MFLASVLVFFVTQFPSKGRTNFSNLQKVNMMEENFQENPKTCISLETKIWRDKISFTGNKTLSSGKHTKKHKKNLKDNSKQSIKILRDFLRAKFHHINYMLFPSKNRSIGFDLYGPSTNYFNYSQDPIGFLSNVLKQTLTIINTYLFSILAGHQLLYTGQERVSSYESRTWLNHLVFNTS